MLLLALGWALLLALLGRWHRRAFLLALWRWARLRALWRWAGLRALGWAHYWRWLAGLLALLLLIRHLSGVLESEINYTTVFTTRNSYRGTWQKLCNTIRQNLSNLQRPLNSSTSFNKFLATPSLENCFISPEKVFTLSYNILKK